MADDKKLQDLARNNPDKFEEYYKKNVNPKADGVTIAQKQKYYKHIDLSSVPKDNSFDLIGRKTSSEDPTKSGGFLKFVKEITFGSLKDFYGSQIGQSGSNGTETIIGDILNKVEKDGINVLKLIEDSVYTARDLIINRYKDESELLDQINTKTTLTGGLSKSVRLEIEDTTAAAKKYGYSMANVGEMYVKLVEESGKFNLLNEDALTNALPVARAFDMTLSEMGSTFKTFQDVGIGANKTIDTITAAGVKSNSLGLSGKKVITDMKDSISKLNEYGFQNGVKGLETMVRKSLEFKVNFNDVARIADKVFSPEGAVELTANLQMIGGAIGDFNDPLKLMYMSTNNIEGLQDSLIGAAGALATYNKEQGKFEITGANLRQAKAMADAFGMSLGDLNKAAIATAERTVASTALMSRGFTIDDEQKEFLTNLASMENGQMVIKLPKDIATSIGAPINIALDELTEKQRDGLMQYQEELKKTNPEDMAMAQLTTAHQATRYLEQLVEFNKGRATRAATGLAKGVGKTIGLDGVGKNFMETLKTTSKSTENVPYRNTEARWSNFGEDPLGVGGRYLGRKMNDLFSSNNQQPQPQPQPVTFPQSMNVVVTNMPPAPNSFSTPQPIPSHLQPHQ
jgi:hypothetical protein